MFAKVKAQRSSISQAERPAPVLLDLSSCPGQVSANSLGLGFLGRERFRDVVTRQHVPGPRQPKPRAPSEVLHAGSAWECVAVQEGSTINRVAESFGMIGPDCWGSSLARALAVPRIPCPFNSACSGHRLSDWRGASSLRVPEFCSCAARGCPRPQA